MDKRQHLLETFKTVGSDGQIYLVHGYEHLAHLEGTPDFDAHWQPTGRAEYRVSSGEPITVHANGDMALPAKALVLRRQAEVLQY